MNATELVLAVGHDLDRLRAEFHPVDLDRVRILPAPAPLRLLLPRDVGAIAIWKRIYIRPELFYGEPRRIRYLILHELVHVRQWVTFGVVGFLRRYLSEYFRGRRKGLGHAIAYQSNRLELEARQLADSYRTV